MPDKETDKLLFEHEDLMIKCMSLSQLPFACLKSTIETLDERVKFVQR